MFLTWVACSQELLALALDRVGPVAGLAVLTQVRFMLPADSRSTSALPSAPPKYQIAVHVVVRGQHLRQLVARPVTMFTTPPGTSEVSSTW